MKKQIITVTIPTFNRLDLLKRTLSSVFAQTEKPDEIIVVDNCSDDGTWQYLQTFLQIKAYRNTRNIGSFENINKAISLVSSEYFVCLNSDDLLLPDYIRVAKMNIAKLHKQGVVAFMNAGYIIDIKDKVKGQVQPQSQNMLFIPPNGVKKFMDNNFSTINLSGWTVYKRDLFDKIGYPDRKYGRSTENELTLKMLSSYPVYYSSQPLFALRVHQEQGFEVEPGDTGGWNRIFNDIEDGYKVLLDYEKKEFIQKLYTKKELEERVFIRKPVMYVLFLSVYSLLMFNLRSSKRYFSIFLHYYPRPILTLSTFILFIQETMWLGKIFFQMRIVRLKFQNRKIV